MKSMTLKGDTFRRLSALILAFVLAFILCGSVSAADSASGADLRLTAVEGTVSLTNANGNTLSVREGMKLYSGYTITTSAKSYAYITLDSQKVVKMDANSKVQVRSKGSKLEVMVSSGKLFFNVKSPLSSSESLNIRTSTMVTGIRGTSGYISVLDAHTSTVTITDGKVQVWATDAEGTENGLTEVLAGQVATGSAGESGVGEITLSGLLAEDVPGFVATELQKDAELRQRVEEATGLPVDEIAAEAGERLEQDEQEAETAQESAVSAKVTPLPLFQKPTWDIGFTPLPQLPEDSESTSEPDTSEPDTSTYQITGSITGTELTELLSQYDCVTATTGASITLSSSETVTVESGKTLSFELGSTLTNDGTLINEGTVSVENNASFSNAGTFINTGVFTNKAFGTRNNGAIENSGTFAIQNDFNNNGSFSTSGSVTIDERACFSSDGDITVASGGSITIDINSRLLVSKTLVIQSGGTVYNNGKAEELTGTIGISNTGTIEIQTGGSLVNNGDYYNGNGNASGTTAYLTVDGIFTNYGILRNDSDSSNGSYITIGISGSLTSTGSIINCGQISNNGTLTNDGSYTDNVDNWFFGTVTGNGTWNGTNPIYS